MDFERSSSSSTSFPQLEILDPSIPHTFRVPGKCINQGPDVARFLTSKAYRDIGVFVLQLNRALCPRKNPSGGASKTFPLVGGDRQEPDSVRKLRTLLETTAAIIDEAPPDKGPRRFGNISFRKWYGLLEERVDGLLRQFVSRDVLRFPATDGGDKDGEEEVVGAFDELKAYFLGSFGSSQRLDYGTGHELSFLAFLGCLWKLGAFKDGSQGGCIERSLVLGVFESYVDHYSDSLADTNNSFFLLQISQGHTSSHSHIHSRTSRLTRGMGSRRPLFHTLHLWLRTTHPTDHRERGDAA